MRMGVDQPRADSKPLQINNSVRFGGNRTADFQNPVVLNQYIARSRRRPCPVIDHSVSKECFHAALLLFRF